MTATTVIVGTGIAGATAALTLRADGDDGRIVLLGDEADEPYRRPPLSKDVLRGTMPAERTRLRPSTVWAERDIELHTATTAVTVDPDAYTVGLDDGTRLRYDRLLLATGGRPRTLDVAEEADAVVTLRTLSDVPELRRRLTAADRALVVGAGLIGAEVAATARRIGCAVTMLEAQPWPLARLLPPQVARIYANLHREQGVDLHTGIDLTELAADGDGVRAVDADGRAWHADVGIVAIGLQPRTELAEQAGIAVDDGIVVDECFRTSAPGVFAAGDVANLPNPVLGGRYRAEHWQSAQEQGAAAARRMAGDSTGYRAVPWCWSEQYGSTVQVTGWPPAADDVTIRGDLDGLDFTAIFAAGDRLVGAVGVNRAREIRTMRRLIDEAPHADPAMLAAPDTDLAALDPATLSTNVT